MINVYEYIYLSYFYIWIYITYTYRYLYIFINIYINICKSIYKYEIIIFALALGRYGIRFYIVDKDEKRVLCKPSK